MNEDGATSSEWHRVLAEDDLPEGRVTTAHAGLREIALVHYDGYWAALDNRCPHQGGPLGEGSIENGLLRCPWHGYDYDPLTGASPGEFDTPPPVSRSRSATMVVYVGVERPAEHERTVSDVMAETMVNWGVRHVFGMVGHSNLGLADAIRRQEEAGKNTYIGIRHEGAAAFAASAYGKLTGEPAACLTIAGAGRDQPPHRSLGREGRPLPRTRAHRPGRGPGARPRRLPGGRPGGRVRPGRRVQSDRPALVEARRAHDAGRQEREPSAAMSRT